MSEPKPVFSEYKVAFVLFLRCCPVASSDDKSLATQANITAKVFLYSCPCLGNSGSLCQPHAFVISRHHGSSPLYAPLSPFMKNKTNQELGKTYFFCADHCTCHLARAEVHPKAHEPSRGFPR